MNEPSYLLQIFQVCNCLISLRRCVECRLERVGQRDLAAPPSLDRPRSMLLDPATGRPFFVSRLRLPGSHQRHVIHCLADGVTAFKYSCIFRKFREDYIIYVINNFISEANYSSLCRISRIRIIFRERSTNDSIYVVKFR